MSTVVSFVVMFIVWSLLFKRFFKNAEGFSHAVYCAFTSGYNYFRWSGEGEWDRNVGAAVKFIAWLALGGIAGSLAGGLVGVIL